MYIHVFVLIVDIEVHLMCLICLYKYCNTAFTIGESSQWSEYQKVPKANFNICHVL